MPFGLPRRGALPTFALTLAWGLGMPWVTRAEDPAAKAAAPKYATDIVPLLKAYCFECHNPSKRRGGLDLESIDGEPAAVELTDLWKDVGARLHTKDMPPAKSKQPSDTERAKLNAWVGHVATSQVDYSTFTKDQLTRALALPATNRRLNRDEYNNTIRDLFGVDFRVGDLLPSEGGGGEGFDNAGATLFITPVLIEKYLDAAELVLGTLLPADDAKRDGLKPDLATARKRLLVSTPGPGRTPHDAAQAVLETFVPRAFRRPATADDIAKPLALFDAAFVRGESYELALKLSLKRVLISPHFLFLIEAPAATTGVTTLGPYELASHLSYFLWASMPDETLIGLAAQDKLKEETVLREQVRRMLRDPRSRGFTDGFGAQWLGIRPLGQTVRPDAKAFPEFDAELAAAMREETVLFFDAIVKEDRSLLDVIHADFTFVNERLAKHYGLPDVKGPEMRRVTLKDPARGGVLGHGSILTVTSFPHRTSPVLRGRWILEELLGSEVPPPPPDAPVLNERQKTDTNLTFRQLLEKHRAKSECATCHNRMDPLGFGLENFDPIGRWRTDLAGKPLDTAGVLPTGETFKGPAELKRLILDTRKAEFLRNVSRKALGYATGREVRNVDLCVVRDCVRALEQRDYRLSQLIETIVVSVPFSHRLPTP
jgi:mono/diheme cytochrome c family protein